MSESETMKQLHSIREKNYERMKQLSVKEQIKIIQTEAEAIKKRILDKIKKGNCPQLADNRKNLGVKPKLIDEQSRE